MVRGWTFLGKLVSYTNLTQGAKEHEEAESGEGTRRRAAKVSWSSAGERPLLRRWIQHCGVESFPMWLSASWGKEGPCVVSMEDGQGEQAPQEAGTFPVVVPGVLNPDSDPHLP